MNNIVDKSNEKRSMELPCLCGDTVYVIKHQGKLFARPLPCRVEAIHLYENLMLISLGATGESTWCRSFLKEDMGNTVFMDEQTAEEVILMEREAAWND